MVARPATTTPSRPPGPSTGVGRAGLGAAIWSQLFLRIAQSAGLLVIGSYLVDLHDRGAPITSVLVGAITLLPNLTEFFTAPLAGAWSDRLGRKLFLVAGPALSMVAILLPLGTLGYGLGAVGDALPPLGLALGLLAATRLLEGVGGGAAAPATLGLLSEATVSDPLRRGRQMGFFELATSGGVALGAVLGPLLWARLHLVAFAALSGLYLLAAALVLLVREGPRPTATVGALFDPRRYVALFADRRLQLFTPAWIAVNAIVGVWVTAQTAFVLSADLHVPGQRFVGSLHSQPTLLSLILGGYVLWFALGVLAWAAVVGRLPKLPVLLVTIGGTVIASVGLLGLNHGAPMAVFVPIALAGVLIESGFGPAALAYLADISEAFAADRGRLMGIYSVILGAGYLLGTGLGGVFAQVAYFDGMVYLTVLLAAVGMLFVVLLLARRDDADQGRIEGLTSNRPAHMTRCCLRIRE